MSCSDCTAPLVNGHFTAHDADTGTVKRFCSGAHWQNWKRKKALEARECGDVEK